MRLGILFILLTILQSAFAQTFSKVERLSLNTRDFNEFGPVFYGNGIIFCSDRKTSLSKSYVNSETNKYFLNIYYVNNYSEKKAVFFHPDLNSIANDGPLCFNADSTIIYVSRNFDLENTRNELSKVGLFKHIKQDNGWSEAIAFEHNIKDYNTGHPWLSPDGNILFFSSDRPGGYGKFDIYYCIKDGDTWSAPTNLGSSINSDANEVFPFVHISQRLYFSSDRNPEMGFDIYYSAFSDSIYTVPVLLEPPINSTYDDFSFICDETAETGYFASNRRGSDDIYRFSSTFPIFNNCDTIVENIYCFTFYEESNYYLDTLPMVYEWDFGDGTKIKGLNADYCFPGPGLYHIYLNIIDTLTGDIFQNEANYLLNIEDIIQAHISCPDTVNIGSEVIFDASKTNLPESIIDQYYWSFSDGIKSTGISFTRIFEKAGTYKVNLGIHYDRTEAGEIKSTCVYKTIIVL